MSRFPVQRLLPPSADQPPTLLVVVDTEEEFDWNAPFDPGSTSVENIGFQPLAQRLFDAHGVAPTYVIDYPVAATPSAVAVLKPIFDNGRCDIGAHLHPWVNPPAGEAVNAFHSFPHNLPGNLMRQKLAVLTEQIERSFGRRPLVYKAGRYGVGAATPQILRELGYQADASVVPHTDFSDEHGPDFTGLPDAPFVAAEGLLEVPLSVHFVGRAAGFGKTLYPKLQLARGLRLPGIAARLGLLERLRLSPEGHSLSEMIRQTNSALADGARYFMMTYHSSTLMPGITDYARDVRQRDKFLQTIAGYLEYFMALRGATTTTIRAMLHRSDLSTASQLPTYTPHP